MKLITELIEFALRRNWLSDEDKLKLESGGFYKFDWSDQARRHDPLEIDEEDLLEADSVPRSLSSNRRHGKSKSESIKPNLTDKELNQYIQEEWEKLTEEYPQLQPLWDSWKTAHLPGVLADGFTLNDVYTVLAVELRDYCHDFSGSAPAAYRQLLRQRGIAANKYSWLMKYPAIVNMIHFVTFQQQIHQEIKTLYETDRKAFARLSSQNGKLDFPNWEQAVQTDTTSMRVWTILDLPSAPVTLERIKEILTWKNILAFAMQIDFDFVTKLVTQDWSSLTVITGNNSQKAILTSVIIPEGEVRIRNGAFSRCSTLKTVVVPDSVTDIQENAFAKCAPSGGFLLSSNGEYLLDVNNDMSGELIIPDSVKIIAPSAFWNCRSLTSVVIPEGITKLGRYMFKGCRSLTSIVIPNSIEEIQGGTFANGPVLTQWSISPTHPHFKSDGAGLLSKDGETLIACLPATEEYQIPEDVIEIKCCAFQDCRSLKSVVIPEGITEISEASFRNCSALTSIKIPESVTEIGMEAFEGCRSLTSVEIPKGVRRLHWFSFKDCTSLRSAYIYGINTALDYPFENCSLTIHGPYDSLAEEYAIGHYFPFVPLR